MTLLACADDKLIVTHSEAMRMHDQSMSKLLEQRRLLLVLDLDLTLVHATTASELQASVDRMGRVRLLSGFFARC